MSEERKLNNISHKMCIGKLECSVNYCNEFDGVKIEGIGYKMTMSKCEFIRWFGKENRTLAICIAKEHCNSLRNSMKYITDPIAIGMFLKKEIHDFKKALKTVGIYIGL